MVPYIKASTKMPSALVSRNWKANRKKKKIKVLEKGRLSSPMNDYMNTGDCLPAQTMLRSQDARFVIHVTACKATNGMYSAWLQKSVALKLETFAERHKRHFSTKRFIIPGKGHSCPAPYLSKKKYCSRPCKNLVKSSSGTTDNVTMLLEYADDDKSHEFHSVLS